MGAPAVSLTTPSGEDIRSRNAGEGSGVGIRRGYWPHVRGTLFSRGRAESKLCVAANEPESLVSLFFLTDFPKSHALARVGAARNP